ncbi:DUF4738 domain-containing protein [uncultured Bacteroides sp.]|uniref:DUF4738 domain-containing protein n=1 Tax=uncultured Bacteroides sp. TaxID=162156 RepID=UPI0025E4ABA4|nr:DUF4738 domain-containing protein [uncultured Bacteroides sp.]
MKKLVIELCCVILLVACGIDKGQNVVEEDTTAKTLLQGVWINDETELPLVRIEGDTIYYADPQNIPVSFKIVRDTMYVYGSHTVAYKIDRQTEYSFWFHSLADEIVKLHKSESPDDMLAFDNKEVEIIPTTEVVKKDSIVMYKGTRYRGYVYINPSKMKVIRSSYSEGGISVDNIYYDNVIHICVYEGRRMLYGRDITKKIFSAIFPEDTLKQMILADMNFMGVNDKGYRYQATLCVPESSVYSLVDIAIGFDNQMKVYQHND